MKVTDGIFTEVFLQKAEIVFSTLLQDLHQISVAVDSSILFCLYTYTQISSAMLITPRRRLRIRAVAAGISLDQKQYRTACGYSNSDRLAPETLQV